MAHVTPISILIIYYIWLKEYRVVSVPFVREMWTTYVSKKLITR